MPNDKNHAETRGLTRQLRELKGRILLKKYRSPEEHAAIMEEIAAIRIKLLGPLHAVCGDFVRRLVNRQGTVLPDFESLYDQRNRLDGKLFYGIDS